MTFNYKQLGKKIKNFRLEKRLSQEKLAELCNLSTSYISYIETGKKKINFSKLECTRSNGDVVVVWFNEDGIRKMTINEEIPDSVELLNYQLQFISDFTLIKLIDEDLINEYRKAVLEYEIDNGATCKQ